MKKHDLSEILNHLGEDRDRYFSSVAPPVMQSSNFVFPDVATMRTQLLDEFNYQLYTRGNNPTTDILRKKIAALEETEDALILSSGSAAVAAAIMANVQTGNHIVSVQNPYTWTKKLMNDILPRFGVNTTYVDGTDHRNFEKALIPDTKVIYLESPNSFTFELQDLEKISALARAHDIVTITDNSYCSPLFQKPHRFGIDIVVHSATKYLAGHSDLVAGVICASSDMIQKIFANEFMTLGAKLSPQDSWLMIRGLRTLEIRMERIDKSARQIVDFVSQHPGVEKVYYPYHPENPQIELANKQMTGGGGLFTLALKTSDVEQVEAFCNSLKRFLLAVSWGGYESLVFPATAGSEKGSEQNIATINLIRFYIGLEDPELLMEDIGQALEKIQLHNDR